MQGETLRVKCVHCSTSRVNFKGEIQGGTSTSRGYFKEVIKRICLGVFFFQYMYVQNLQMQLLSRAWHWSEFELVTLLKNKGCNFSSIVAPSDNQIVWKFHYFLVTVLTLTLHKSLDQFTRHLFMLYVVCFHLSILILKL